jgi:hypothetical protein
VSLSSSKRCQRSQGALSAPGRSLLNIANRDCHGICISAVSDIHGGAEQLAKVIATIDHQLSPVRPKRPIQVFLGDDIDRGPASRQLIDMLVDRGQRHETIFLKGNHEAMLLDLLRDLRFFQRSRNMAGYTLCCLTDCPLRQPWPRRATGSDCRIGAKDPASSSPFFRRPTTKIPLRRFLLDKKVANLGPCRISVPLKIRWVR